jgi:Uncharacterized conserved protein (COG2071)
LPYWLKRHFVPIAAHFDFTLALTYAFPVATLEPLIAPGLRLDTYQQWGFVAIALVATRQLRPRGIPAALGCAFFLTGYRIFTRYRTAAGRELRGLRIIRSDTDSRLMAIFGNVLTHYHYSVARVSVQRSAGDLTIDVATPSAVADLRVRARTANAVEAPPTGSPFSSNRDARRFAGPMPFTFDYEPETHSIIRVEGVRHNWQPRPISVDIERVTFFDHPPFAGGPRPILASAYFLEDVPYQWRRGIREP